jgi:hypothetical protein
MTTLPAISPEIFGKYQEEISKSSSAATTRRKATSLKKFFSWAESNGKISQSPIASPVTTVNPSVTTSSGRKIGFKTWAILGITAGIAVLAFLLVSKLKFPIPFKINFAQESDIQTQGNRGTNSADQTNLGPDSIPANSAIIAGWNLFTKLRFVGSDGTPNTSGQTVSFKVYNTDTGGSPLYSSQPQTVTPDSDGSALISLDSVPTNLFFENNRLYLEPEVGGQIISQRIPVPSANSASSLNGYTAADPEIGAGPENVPVIDSTGSLVLASESPTIKATQGNLSVEGQSVVIKTTDGSDGDIEINPDLNGYVHFLFEGSNNNFLNAQAPNLTNGSLYYGMVPNNATGYDLIKLQSGAPKMSTRFSVDAIGNTYIDGILAVDKDIATGGEYRLTSEGELINITGYEQVSGNFTISQNGENYASIVKNDTALSDVLNLVLNEHMIPGSHYSTLVLKRYGGDDNARALLVYGNSQFNGQVQLGNYSSNPTAIGEGSIVYNTSDGNVYYWDGSAWVQVATGASSFSGSFADLTSGTNTIATMTVGTGASLNYSGTGTINASTLNSIASTSFLRSDTSDNFTSGTLTTDAGTTLDVNGDVSIADTNIAFDGASTTFTTTGDLTLAIGGGDLILSDTNTINIGGSGSDVVYNAIANSVAGASASMDSDNDLYIEGDLEVDGTLTAGTLVATSVPFSGITTGTNLVAAMTVGTGASLNYTGSGTINASSLEGSTWEAPGTIGSGTPNSGAFTTLSSTGITTIGNGSATVAINSSDWDINTTGDMTGIGNISADGTIALTGTTIGLGTSNSPTTVNIATGTGGNSVNIATDNSTKDTVSIGSSLDDVIINGAGTGSLINFANFDVDTSGNASMAGSLTLGNGSTIKPAYGPLTLSYKSGADTYGTGLLIRDTSGDVEIAGGAGDTGCTVTNSNGNLVCTGTISGSGIVATSVPFSGITSGTNTTAAMVVDTGASLTYSNSGTINASSLIGGTWAAPGAIGSGTPNSGAFTTLTSSGNSTIGTGASTTNTFGAGASSINTIGSTTTPGALTLHGATTLDNTASISGVVTIGNGATNVIQSPYGSLVLNYKSGADTWTGSIVMHDVSGDIDLAGGYAGGSGCTIVNSTGTLTCTSISGTIAGSVSFTNITSGTNTGATMTVDTGASLTYSNSGTINASSLQGATWASPLAIGTAAPAAGNFTSIGITSQGSGAFTTLTSSGNSTIGTGASTTNTFGAGASSINTIGSTTTPGALTLHGATTLDNTASISGVVTIGNGATNVIQSPYGPLVLNYKSGADTWTPGITLADNTGNVTLASDLAVNGGDITSTGALNITPGGALTLGATGQNATLQGAITLITSTGAGNDITLTSADQIILNSTGTIELQDATNISGNLGVTGTASVSGTLTIGNGSTIQPAYGPLTLSYKSGDDSYATGLLIRDTSGDVEIAGGVGDTGCTVANSTGSLTCSAGITATALPFSGITSGTNTQAAMVVGTGASLDYTGSGTINASTLIGSTWAAPGTIGSGTPNTGAFTTLTSSGNSTIGTGASTTNTFGAGASSVNTIGSVTTPGALTLHGATTLDNTFTVSGNNYASISGVLTVGNGVTNVIQSPYGPLVFNYKSGADTWTPGITLLDNTGNVVIANDLTVSGGDVLGANGAAIDIGEQNSGDITTTGDLIVADDSFIGLGAGAGRFVFDSTATPDTITVADADLALGANNLTGTTATINFTNFDIDSSGRITTIDGVTHTIDDVAGDLTLTSNSTNITLNDSITVAGNATMSGVLTVGNGTTNQIRSPYGPLALQYKSGDNAWTDSIVMHDVSGDIDLAGGFGSTGCTINNSTGTITCTAGISASSVSFANITTGTNSTATMTVDSGATLTYSGTGVINASTLIGATWAAPGTIGSGTPNTGAFTTLTSSGNSTIGTGAGTTNTFGAGASSVNTIGSTTTPGALTLHGATTLDNTASISGVVTIGDGTTNNIRPPFGPLTLSYKSGPDTWTTGFTLIDTTGNVVIAQDLAVNGGDITTSQATATLFDTTATTLSLGGAATTALNIGNGIGNYASIALGSGAGTHVIDIAGTGATAADTINIGTGGTAADIITVGNNASTTSLALTSGTGDVAISSTDLITLFPTNEVRIGNATDYASFNSSGDVTFVDADGAASITGPAGGALSVLAGASQALTLTGNAASVWSTTGGLTLRTTSGNLLLDTATAGDVTIGPDTSLGTGDDLFFQDGTTTTAIPLTLADTGLNAILTQAIIDAINDVYDIAVGAGGTSGFWQLNNKILSPANSTYDLTIGGTATGSAFQAFGAETETSGVQKSTSTITTTGNVFEATASAVTTGNLVKIGLGGTSAFSGNGILVEVDPYGAGSFTGNFLKLNANAATIFSIGAAGVLTLANGETIDNSTNGTVNIGATTFKLTGGTDVVSDQTSVNLFNTTTTTLNIGGAVTTLALANGNSAAVLNIGSGTGGNTINVAGTGATGNDTINIGTGATGSDTITVGNANGTTSLALTSGTGDVAISSTDLITIRPTTETQIGNATDYVSLNSSGDITFVDADGAASITGPAGGALSVLAGASQALTLTGNAASVWSTTGGLTLRTTSGNLLLDTATAGDVTIGPDISLGTGDDLFFQDGTMTAAVPLTIADTALNGSLTQAVIDAINDVYDIAVGTGATSGFWNRVAGNLYPSNLNDTISATTSAAIALTLTQTGAFNAFLVQDEASDTTPFVIDQSGKVGIGTTSPLSKLSVITTSANSTGKAALLVDQYESQDILTASASGATKLRLSSGGSLYITGNLYPDNGAIQTTRFFGDNGTSLTASNLAMSGTLDMNNQSVIDMSYMRPATDNIDVQTTGANSRFRFQTSTGSLQISGAADSTNPVAVLDVRGTASVSGILTVGNGTTNTIRSPYGDLVLQSKTNADTYENSIVLNDISGDIDLAGGSGSTGCTISNSAGTITCSAGVSASALEWNSLTDPDGPLSLTMGAGEETTFNVQSTTQNGFTWNTSTLTSGNLIYATASSALTGNLIKLGSGGDSGNFTGNGLLMDFDNTGGSSFTGNFLKFDNAGVTKLLVDSSGVITGGTTTTSDLFLKTTTAAGIAGSDMHFLVGNNGATEAMTIVYNGSIGIQNTNPWGALDIKGGYLTLDNGDFGALRGIRFRDVSDTTQPTGGGLYQANNDVVYLQGGNNASSPIIFRNGSGTNMAGFSTTGDFGIGDTAADDDDFLNFDIGAESLMWDDSPGQFVLSDDLVPGTDDTFDLGSSPSARWRNVFLGPASLHLLAKTTDSGYSGLGLNLDYAFGINTTGTLTTSVNNSAKTYLTKDGNFGVNTAIPETQLHVTGNGRFTALAEVFQLGFIDGDVLTGGFVGETISANAFGSITEMSATQGGLQIEGGSSSASQTALALNGIIYIPDPTDSVPAINLVGSKADIPGDEAALGSSETVLRVDNFTTPVFTILGSGNISALGVGQFGGITPTTYSRFGTASTGHSLSAAQDLLIGGALELNGILYLDSNTIAASNGTSTISFPADPTALGSTNLLTNGTWLVQNPTAGNPGLAALMVNQQKGGDIFTASASGSPKFTITNAGNVGIGTTAPSAKLHVLTDSTATSGDIWSTLINGTISTGTTGSYYGQIINPTANAPVGNTLGAMAGSYIAPSNTGSGGVTTLFGIYVAPSYSGSGAVSSMYAGLFDSAKNSTASASNLTGVYARVSNNNATGSVTNGYGVYIEDSGETGTITNDFGVYQVDTGAYNYFGGIVGIGDTSPDYTLELSGSTTPTFAMSDTDVTHGMSGFQTDTFFHIKEYSTDGGVQLHGIADASTIAFEIQGGFGVNPATFAKAISLVGFAGSAGSKIDLDDTDTILQVVNNDNTAALTILGNNNVGISDTTPSFLLTLRNPTTVSDTLGWEYGANAASRNWGFRPDVTAFGDFQILTSSAKTAGLLDTARLTINPSGNVGIGTTSPPTPLTVVGGGANSTGGITVQNVTTDATTKDGRLKVGHYTNSEEPVTLMIGAITSTVGNLNIGGGSASENAMTEIRFFTAANNTTLTGTQAMTIDSSGNVGIGTSNPRQDLDVTGNIIQSSGINMLGDQESMAPNAGFESGTGTVADNWSGINSASGSQALTSTSLQGEQSQNLVVSVGGGAHHSGVISDCIPVTGGTSYNLSVKAVASTAPGSTALLLYGYTFTSLANCNSSPGGLGGTGVNFGNPTPTTSAAGYGGTQTLASDANWIRVHVYNWLPTNAYTLTIDSVRFTPSALSIGVDLAENYPVSNTNTPQKGDIVTLGGYSEIAGIATITKSMEPYDKNFLGVVSTNPALVLDDGIEYQKAAVALSGRAPVNIDPSSRPILIGDYITSSGNGGMGMKATKPGTVVGKALESWEPNSGKESILVFVNLSNYDPDIYLTSTDSFNIIAGNLVNNAGEIIDRIGAFGQIVAAKITVGAITAKEGIIEGGFKVADTLIAGTIETQSLVANSFTALQGTVDYMLVKSGLVANNIQASLISPVTDSTDVTVRIGSVATPSGKFAIQDSTGSEVASIDNEGDAFFAGTVESQQLAINNDATVSGTLFADEIKSKSLDDINALLSQVKSDQDLMKDAADWSTLTATNSASLDQLVIANLYVTNQGAFNALSVSNSLTVGSDLVFLSAMNNEQATINSINTLSYPLRIQSLAMAPVEIMAGLVTIDTQGNVRIAGNLNVAGRIESSGLTLKDNEQLQVDNTQSLLSLQDSSGSSVAGVDASGSALFNSLTTPQLVIAGSDATEAGTIINGTITTNSTIGKAFIPAGTSEITINNPKVTDYTLVYVTPTSTTQNYVLYVKSKQNGQFVVGFDQALDVDVNFNWWIVQVQN